MMTRTKHSRKACACNLPVATAPRVRYVPTARKEKLPLVSYSYSGEKNMKRNRWRNDDKPQRAFRRSMPCELRLRQPMRERLRRSDFRPTRYIELAKTHPKDIIT